MLLSVSLTLLEGLVVTLELFALTLLFALPLGLIISFGSMSRCTPLRAVVKTIVWIVRGTPAGHEEVGLVERSACAREAGSVQVAQHGCGIVAELHERGQIHLDSFRQNVILYSIS